MMTLAYRRSDRLVLTQWGIFNPWVRLNVSNNSGIDIPGLLDPDRSSHARLGDDGAIRWNVTQATRRS